MDWAQRNEKFRYTPPPRTVPPPPGWRPPQITTPAPPRALPEQDHAALDESERSASRVSIIVAGVAATVVALMFTELLSQLLAGR